MEQDNIQTPSVLTLLADFVCVAAVLTGLLMQLLLSSHLARPDLRVGVCAVLLSVVLSSPSLLTPSLSLSSSFLLLPLPVLSLTVARRSLGSAGRMKVRSHSYVRTCLAVGGGVAAGVRLLVQVSDSAPWVHLRRRRGQGSHRHFNGLRASLPPGSIRLPLQSCHCRARYWSPSLARNAKIIILYYGRNLSVSLFPEMEMQTD